MHNASPARSESAEQTATDIFLRELDSHWTGNSGFREGTRKKYLVPARRFMKVHFPSGDLNWGLLTPAAVADFVTAELQQYRNRSTQRNFCTAIRALLRYLRLKHSILDGTESLLPRLPYWRHASIPRRLSEDQLASLLGGCAGETPIDLRRRCLLLLFTRLGMRTGEVAALSVDDVDWANGCIFIKGSKNRRDRSLPLPVDVGECLVAHLRSPRPINAPRFVFLASRPPYTSTQNCDRVRTEIRKELREAGISGVRLGAHVLRHTVASTMVNRGASFKEVADVLGHKSLRTTGIYAKLDLTSLAAVALPWSGVAGE